jgi:hypothetical protein
MEVEVRGEQVPFLQCKTCQAVFMQRRTISEPPLPVSISRHIRTHQRAHRGAGEIIVDSLLFEREYCDVAQCCGSGSGAFLTPGSRIPDPRLIFLRA